MSSVSEFALELALSSNITMNVILSLLFIILFIPLRILLPEVYAPNGFLLHKRNGWFGFIFWFIDVFRQPLSVYSTRGNVALIFVVFQVMVLVLYAFLSIMAISILIPCYLVGTDAELRSAYPTVWSYMTLTHLNRDSWLMIVPITVVIITSVALMFFYDQFMAIYVHFRQRCMTREIPQNFTVMLSNIPSDIDTVEELQQFLQPLLGKFSEDSLPLLIPVPPQTNKLNGLFSKVKGLNVEQDEIVIKKQVVQSKIFEIHGKLKSLQNNLKEKSSQAKQTEYSKKIKSLERQESQYNNELTQVMKKLRKCREDIHTIIFQDNIDITHSRKIYRCPPNMPQQTLNQFTFIDNFKAQKNCSLYSSPIDLSLERQQMNIDKQQIMRMFEKRHFKDNHGCSTYAFLVFKTTSDATKFCSQQLAVDQVSPKSSLAPSFSDVRWDYLRLTSIQNIITKLIFLVALVAVFIAFFVAIIFSNSLFDQQSRQFSVIIYDALRFPTCPQSSSLGNNSPENMVCNVVFQIASILPGFAQSLLSAIIMTLVPLFIDIVVGFLKLPSTQQARNYSYNLLFLFLILLQGVIHIAFPQFFNSENLVKFSINDIGNITFFGFFRQLGYNLATQQFNFINYIINKYFLFPTLGLLNFGQLIFYGVSLFMKNSFKRNQFLRIGSFNYQKQLAYTTHMLVISLLFYIVTPFISIIVFITYLTMVCVDRAQILYLYPPHSMSDLSAEADFLRYVPSNIFLGLVLMQFGIFAYLFQFNNVGYIFCNVIVVLCLCVCIYYRIKIDRSFQRAIGVKAVANEKHFSGRLLINIASDKAKEVVPINQEVRQSIFDKLLSVMYTDLLNLPVSCVKKNDLYSDEVVCVCLKETDGVVSKEDQQRIAATYTHPALQLLQVNDLNSDNLI